MVRLDVEIVRFKDSEARIVLCCGEVALLILCDEFLEGLMDLWIVVGW